MEQILASDPVPAAREAFASGLALRTSADNREVVRNCNLLILAVKPQTMPGLLAEIGPVVTGSHLIVSIAAGVSLAQLTEGLGPQRRIVRVMPNTPCLIGASASAYTPGDGVGSEDLALIDRLLNAVGRAFRVPETL